MTVRNRQNALALAIGALALAIATTGTAAAVTGTAMNITDPVNAAYKAKVDSAGRLSTLSAVSNTVTVREVPAATVFNSALYIGLGASVLVGPTTATLAVDRMQVMNPGQNYNYANTNFTVRLARRVPDSSGSCYTGSITNIVNASRLPAGADIERTYPTPLVFRPTGTAPYCITAELSAESTTPGSYYLPFAELTGYVVGGTYTGPTLSFTGAVPDKAPLAVKGQPLPAGAAARR